MMKYVVIAVAMELD